MKTVWLVVWLASNCGYDNRPECTMTACYCRMAHRYFDDAFSAGKFAGEHSPYSYAVEITSGTRP